MATQMSRFLHDLYEKELKFKRTETEVCDIKEAVYELVEKIRVEISKNKLYEVSRIRLVGSMAEGTSIIEPNEFDFLMILDHLSDSNAITIEYVREPTDECLTFTDFEYWGTSARYAHKHHHAHVKFDCKPTEPIFKRFEDCLNYETKKYLSSNYLANPFKKVVVSACTRIGEELDRTQDFCIKKKSGELKFGHIDRMHPNGPAIKIELLWNPILGNGENNLNICVDIVPVIEVIDTSLIIQEEAESAKYHTVFKNEGSYVLSCPTKKSYCFNFSFTTSEVELVKMLSLEHRICYCILKYFFLECGVALSSYIFKTFLLHHSASCTQMGGISYCVRDILSTMGNNIKCDHDKGVHFDEKCTFMHSNFVSTYLFNEEKKRKVCQYINDIIGILSTEDDSENYSYVEVKDKIDKPIADLVSVFSNLSVNVDMHAG